MHFAWASRSGVWAGVWSGGNAVLDNIACGIQDATPATFGDNRISLLRSIIRGEDNPAKHSKKGLIFL
jgi:hypothetical protein